MVPESHPLAAGRGAFNAVFVEGEACGELMFYGRGAGGPPTASAVLGDLIDAAHHLRSGSVALAVPRRKVRFLPAEDLRCEWYINIDVADQPGVLAEVATVFGANGVSIRTMEQVGLGPDARLIFLTHVAREGDVVATLDGLRRLDVVEQVGGVLRVAGEG
jgi:homoserine dehydrogenase